MIQGLPVTSEMTSETDTMLEVPIDLVWVNDSPLVVLGLCSLKTLELPFWDDVARARQKVTRMEPLDSMDIDTESIGLIGGVFHTTRCGSTLVMRQFSALPGVFGLSEPSMIQKLLAGPRTDAERDRGRMRKLLALFARGLSPLATRIVIKWPNLCGLHVAFLASTLPTVPSIFLYRDAGEIMQSIERNPLGGMDNLRPRHLFSPEMIAQGARIPDDHMTRAIVGIARVCETVRCDPDIVAVDYRELPGITWQHLAGFFGLSLSPADVELMRKATIPHSKSASGAPFRERNTPRATPGDQMPVRAEQHILEAAIEQVRRNMPGFSGPDR